MVANRKIQLCKLYLYKLTKTIMKKVLIFGFFIAGFAMTSVAQNAIQTNVAPAIEVAKVSTVDAVAPAKPCCKKQGTSVGCNKVGSASAIGDNAPAKPCCAGGAEHKCSKHEGSAAAPAVGSTASTPEKKHCGEGCQKPCCKKGN